MTKQKKIRHTKHASGSAHKTYVKLFKKAGLKAIRSSYLGRKNFGSPIEKYDKGSASPPIKTAQFPLTLISESTVQKILGSNLEQGLIYFDLQKQTFFGPGK